MDCQLRRACSLERPAIVIVTTRVPAGMQLGERVYPCNLIQSQVQFYTNSSLYYDSNTNCPMKPSSVADQP
jgi:hypothetical protein